MQQAWTIALCCGAGRHFLGWSSMWCMGRRTGRARELRQALSRGLEACKTCGAALNAVFDEIVIWRRRWIRPMRSGQVCLSRQTWWLGNYTYPIRTEISKYLLAFAVESVFQRYLGSIGYTACDCVWYLPLWKMKATRCPVTTTRWLEEPVPSIILAWLYFELYRNAIVWNRPGGESLT